MNPRILHQERMVPELMFLSERMSQLSIIDSKVKWPLHFAFTFTYCKQRTSGEAPLQSIQPPRKIRTICTPQLSITDSKVNWLLRFNLFHLFSACYTALQTKTCLQSIQPPRKIWTTPVYKREAIHHTAANRHLGLSAKWHKGGQK